MSAEEFAIKNPRWSIVDHLGHMHRSISPREISMKLLLLACSGDWWMKKMLQEEELLQTCYYLMNSNINCFERTFSTNKPVRMLLDVNRRLLDRDFNWNVKLYKVLLVFDEVMLRKLKPPIVLLEFLKHILWHHILACTDSKLRWTDTLRDSHI